jgi:NAD(P)-dependent dehydrogenase (short-subunit alcohol dehydrogenase family)
MPDRAAIVTGASRGIGLAIAETLGAGTSGREAGQSVIAGPGGTV